MASNFQHFTASAGAPAEPPFLDTTARWLDDGEDTMLGCECANPALQIERWSQEAPGAMSA